jgi:hypothetical protein
VKGEKTMRTKDEINKDLKTSMTALNLLIETSIESEQTFEEKRNDLEKHIKALDVERSYDDTLAGQVHTLTAVVMEKVDLLFNELEQKTGVRLTCRLESQEDESDT